jgi:hypothetical protein
MHAILRVNDHSSFSLYRILMPITLIIFILAYKKTIKVILILILLIYYNFILTVNYTSDYSKFYIMSAHLFSIFNTYLIISYLYYKEGFEKVYNFLFYFLLLSLVVALTEQIFNYRLPNTAEYFDGSVSAFNWNQNELGTIILSFIPLFLVYEMNLIRKYIVITYILFLVYINDSKLVLIGIVIALLVYMIKINIFEKNKILKYIISGIILGSMFIAFFLPYDEIYVSFRDYDISLYQLLGIPISHILTLTPFPDMGGSDTTRANAIIYGITELINSNFMGIGIGNSLIMLEKPEYMMMSAKSMHNLPTQLVVENGIMVLSVYIFIFNLFLKLFFKQKISKHSLSVMIAIPSIFFGSMGSSIGIFSDYYFFASIFLLIIHYKHEERRKNYAK